MLSSKKIQMTEFIKSLFRLTWFTFYRSTKELKIFRIFYAHADIS